MLRSGQIVSRSSEISYYLMRKPFPYLTNQKLYLTEWFQTSPISPSSPSCPHSLDFLLSPLIWTEKSMVSTKFVQYKAVQLTHLLSILLFSTRRRKSCRSKEFIVCFLLCSSSLMFISLLLALVKWTFIRYLINVLILHASFCLVLQCFHRLEVR